MFSNRQIFLEHLHLPQAGSVANIPESAVHFRGNKRVDGFNATSSHKPDGIKRRQDLLLIRVADGKSADEVD